MTVDVPTLIRLEPMRPEHADAVAAIETTWQHRPWTAEVLCAELERDDRSYVVALAEDGRVLGYGGIALAGAEAHVMTIAVDAAQRRRGTGRRLMLALLGAARRRGADAMTLEVRETNAAATALYEELGFASSGVRPGYYPDTGEGARILWLHDLRSPEIGDRLRASAAATGGIPDGLSPAHDEED